MKNFLLVGFITLSFCNLLQSQATDTVYVWPGDVPGETQAKKFATESLNKKGTTTRLTDVTNPLMVVYSPEEAKNNGEAIVVCPGGGYQILAVDKEGYEIAEWLATFGYTAYVLQYRVPNNEKGALQDIQRALRIVRNTNNYSKIGVMGFSAGGSLSTRAATLFNKATYTPVDQIDTLSCRPDFAVLIYPAYLDRGENRALTPELTISDQTPPFFMFGTADDKYGNSSLVMTTALRDHSIPVELHILAKGGHGYGMRPGNVAGETWPSLLKTWLEKQ